MAEKNTKDKKSAAPQAKASAPAIGIRQLAFASFSCGASVMVLEMAGSRVVAPYMGTSLVVWTSLIGIVMASLSLGYWLGGVVSDKKPSPQTLAAVIAMAAFFTALMAFIANPLLGLLSRVVANVYVGSVIAALCLFAIPSVLLGMVSPFIVRLAIHNLGSAGTTVGSFSAISSAGSIVGTFLGGFVLISFFASATILFQVAFVLAVTAAVVYRPGWKKSVPIAAAALAFCFVSESGAMPAMPSGINFNTRYNSVRIAERSAFGTGRQLRILQTDPLGAQSLMFVDRPEELVSEYTRFYDLAFHYKPDTRRVLMLGGGGYCVPKHLGAERPEVELDVVELDPGITEAARKYFALNDRPGQRIFHEDARIFLNREAERGERKYDAIFGDVFGSSYSIPFHLTTVECMRRTRELLTDDGLFIVNIIASIDDPLFSGIYASIAEVFPTVMIFPASFPNSAATRQNVMIVASASDSITQREAAGAEIQRLLSHRWGQSFTPRIAAFTDAFAPVEKYSLVHR
ncbi:MAG: fused MFS/spermidine synthase [Synergistaceae bacterium]|nr:fused MFS/spermidine synthase [Synergistaceae bacterium]